MPACRSAVILTRPKESSVRAAVYLENILGGKAQIIISPVVRVVRTGTAPDLAKYSGVIFTSQSGVDAFAGISIDRRMPAYCVGPRTAAAADSLGFQVCTADRTSKSLLDLIAAAADSGRLLYARGEHVACDLRARLADRGREVDEAVVYRQLLQPFSPRGHARSQGAAVRAPIVFGNGRKARLRSGRWNSGYRTLGALHQREGCASIHASLAEERDLRTCRRTGS